MTIYVEINKKCGASFEHIFDFFQDKCRQKFGQKNHAWNDFVFQIGLYVHQLNNLNFLIQKIILLW